MKKQITILQLNDVHGYLNSHQELFYENSNLVYRECGGYARIATQIKKIREESKNVLLLDCGDTFHGTFPVIDSKGEILIPILNDLNFAAMTAHWDFAYGPKHLDHLVSKLNYPLLAANVYSKKTKQLVYPPVLIAEIDGLKIGIIGLACNIVDKVMPAFFSDGIYFTDGTAELPVYINQLRNENKVDIIILLSHNGFPQDVELIKHNKGVDVVLSAHTHNRLYKPFIVNNTIIIQSGCHGSFIGKLELIIEENKIAYYEHSLIEVSKNIIPDTVIQNKINAALLPYTYLQDKVGETLEPLNRGLSAECTMDNFLLESIKQSVVADVYFSNGWRYGAPIAKGDICLNDLYNIVPMNAEVSTVELKGSEIFELIESNLESTFSIEPLHQMGGYIKRTLGLSVYFKSENPNNSRVQFIFINGIELNPDKVYKAAFLTEQSVAKKFGINRKAAGINAVEAMQIFLKNNNPISISLDKTFILI